MYIRQLRLIIIIANINNNTISKHSFIIREKKLLKLLTLCFALYIYMHTNSIPSLDNMLRNSEIHFEMLRIYNTGKSVPGTIKKM